MVAELGPLLRENGDRGVQHDDAMVVEPARVGEDADAYRVLCLTALTTTARASAVTRLMNVRGPVAARIADEPMRAEPSRPPTCGGGGTVEP